MKRFFNYLFVTVKGICMGAADVIPGVSGGTIAFMTGIYEELVGSINSINGEAVKLLVHIHSERHRGLEVQRHGDALLRHCPRSGGMHTLPYRNS